MRAQYLPCHKYPDAFTAFVDEHDAYDDHDGETDSPTGWFGLAGRSVIFHDDRGAVDRDRYATRAEARAAFERAQDAYSEWCETDDDEVTA